MRGKITKRFVETLPVTGKPIVTTLSKLLPVRWTPA